MISHRMRPLAFNLSLGEQAVFHIRGRSGRPRRTRNRRRGRPLETVQSNEAPLPWRNLFLKTFLQLFIQIIIQNVFGSHYNLYLYRRTVAECDGDVRFLLRPRFCTTSVARLHRRLRVCRPVDPIHRRHRKAGSVLRLLRRPVHSLI